MVRNLPQPRVKDDPECKHRCILSTYLLFKELRYSTKSVDSYDKKYLVVVKKNRGRSILSVWLLVWIALMDGHKL